MVHVINYELRKPGKNYDNLYSAIKSLSGTHWHNTTSSWLIESKYSSGQIYNYLKSHIDGNDELVIFRITSDWAAQLDKANLDWIKGRNFN